MSDQGRVMSTIASHNDNNVYILGAGFSVDAGLPVVSNFTSCMRDCIEWLDPTRSREREAIQNVLTFRHNVAAAGYRVDLDLDNIEDLFSLADALPGTASMTDIRLAVGATLRYAEQVTPPTQVRLRVDEAKGWPTTDQWRSAASSVTVPGPNQLEVGCSIYDYYAILLSGLNSGTHDPNRNTVITFNYDTLLGQSMLRLGLPFDYCLAPDHTQLDQSARWSFETAPRHLPILKLHGSTNWTALDDRLVVYGHYDDVVADAKVPHLVPPTWNKAVSAASVNIWTRAVGALRDATRIIIIGYSMRATDQHFKFLLAAGLMDNSSLRRVVMVNPEATALWGEAQKTFRTDQRRYGVVTLHDAVVKQVLGERDGLRLINRSPFNHEGFVLVHPEGMEHMTRYEYEKGRR